jgi:hypothetical protein
MAKVKGDVEECVSFSVLYVKHMSRLFTDVGFMK